MIVNIFVARSY